MQQTFGLLVDPFSWKRFVWLAEASATNAGVSVVRLEARPYWRGLLGRKVHIELEGDQSGLARFGRWFDDRVATTMGPGG